MRAIAADITGDLKSRVAYILNHYPATRDSDVALQNTLWRTFFGDHIEGEYVALKNFYDLPRPQTITRVRAKIQNDYGLFVPSAEVADMRKTLRRDRQDDAVADKPGPPAISVYSDESGKTQPFLIVGSIWIVDPAKTWRSWAGCRSFDLM